jgi:hypothetical protein
VAGRRVRAAYPAVTSAPAGPRTPELLTTFLSGTDVLLGDDVLDRIDEIVPPGTGITPDDRMFVPSALGDKRT